jgi:hypothetical protein
MIFQFEISIAFALKLRGMSHDRKYQADLNILSTTYKIDVTLINRINITNESKEQ